MAYRRRRGLLVPFWQGEPQDYAAEEECEDCEVNGPFYDSLLLV